MDVEIIMLSEVKRTQTGITRFLLHVILIIIIF